MTFNYYNLVDGETFKNNVEINEEKLGEVYKTFFEKYSNKRNIRFINSKPIRISSHENTLVKNYQIKKIDNQEAYEISYTMYDYPRILQIIDGLMNENTFPKYYDELKKLVYETKQKQIEDVRRKLDMEVRVLDIMLDNKEYDYKKALERIKNYVNDIRLISDFDRNLADDAEMVYETINVTKEKVQKRNKVKSKKKN